MWVVGAKGCMFMDSLLIVRWLDRRRALKKRTEVGSLCTRTDWLLMCHQKIAMDLCFQSHLVHPAE